MGPFEKTVENMSKAEDQDYLYRVYDSIVWLADNRRMSNLGAAKFATENRNHKINYFNEKVIPLLQSFGFPEPGEGRYGDFQAAVLKMWKEE